jgi:hypothetical protein
MHKGLVLLLYSEHLNTGLVSIQMFTFRGKQTFKNRTILTLDTNSTSGLDFKLYH